jgi:L-asparaginase
MSLRKRLAVLQTGGTIAMHPEANEALGFPESRPADHIQTTVPEVFNLADLHFYDLFFEDSSNLNPTHWDKITGALDTLWDHFDGFVILHGTDTMAYTASALSFSIAGINKPVILTGSQIPIANFRSDAKRNLINAVEVATLDIPEVAICFNDAVYRGNRASKLSIADFNAFASPNFAPLATIGLHISVNDALIRQPVSASKRPEFLYGFADGIFVLHLFPGFNPARVTPLLEHITGLVIEAYGCGNSPVNGAHSILPLISQCNERSIPVVMASQAVYDAVDLTKYDSGMRTAELGVWSASDMTIEAAIVKLMFVLKHTSAADMGKELYHLNIAGERQ